VPNVLILLSFYLSSNEQQTGAKRLGAGLIVSEKSFLVLFLI